MLVSAIEMLNEARRGGYGIGAFNTYSLAITRAVI